MTIPQTKTIRILESQQIAYRVLSHDAPVFTVEAAAQPCARHRKRRSISGDLVAARGWGMMIRVYSGRNLHKAPVYTCSRAPDGARGEIQRFMRLENSDCAGPVVRYTHIICVQ